MRKKELKTLKSLKSMEKTKKKEKGKCEHEFNLSEEYIFSDSTSREIVITCDLCGIKYKGIVFKQ